jgi:hypothetical protein
MVGLRRSVTPRDAQQPRTEICAADSLRKLVGGLSAELPDL